MLLGTHTTIIGGGERIIKDKVNLFCRGSMLLVPPKRQVHFIAV